MATQTMRCFAMGTAPALKGECTGSVSQTTRTLGGTGSDIRTVLLVLFRFLFCRDEVFETLSQQRFLLCSVFVVDLTFEEVDPWR